MNNIKIELELPEFEKELSISVVLKKDGEIVTAFSSPSPEISTEKKEKKEPVVEKVVENTLKTTRKKSGGNMMDLVI